MYSIRFFVGFIGTAAAAPKVVWLHERTGSLATATLVMADLAIDTFRARWRSPTPWEELRPELWGVAAAAAE
jgi:hypothetical protein